MARVRSVLPLATLAAAMVVWLSIRMWCGSDVRVWMTSCVLAAWAPFAAAAIFTYVRARSLRDDRIALAWLVRALGMHFVLVWMLGLSDWLRGPPNEPPAWNMDLGAPVVLLSFAPVFIVGVVCASWLLRIARRLGPAVMRPAIPTEHDAGMPFRGVFLVAAGSPTARVPIAPVALGAIGFALAWRAPDAAYWILPACALPMAAFTVRNHRALVPSVIALVALALAVLAGHREIELESVVSIGVVWPWLSIATVAFYLVGVEAMLRARRAHAV